MGLREFVARSRVLVEDIVLTSPRRNFKSRLAAAAQDVRRQVEELEQAGFTALGSVLSQPELLEIRQAIDAALEKRRPDITVMWNAKVQYTRIMNPLRLHARLLELAVHPLVLAIAERYFRRQPYLSDVDLRRVDAVSMEALGPEHVSSSNWHRDMRGRQLKLMAYLSDVTERDSNFSLIPASHRGKHLRKKTYMESRFRDREVENRPTFEWYGAAGDAMLFDTNVIHRLRRKAGARVRDSITYYYTPGQSLFALDYPAGSLDALPEQSRAVFGEPGWPLSRQRSS
jgi:ectoine hydroxylase-related dioxygenase (phytanoyl-CoA dioxygenase family)